MIRADGGMAYGDARGPDQGALYWEIDPQTGELVPRNDTMSSGTSPRFPERSPSQPVSRDDLAQTITLREMYKRLGVGPEAYNSTEDRGSYDPAIGDTMNTDRTSINPFSPDTAAFSTSNQTAADRAFGNFSGNSFGNVGALTPGALSESVSGRGGSQTGSNSGNVNPGIVSLGGNGAILGTPGGTGFLGAIPGGGRSTPAVGNLFDMAALPSAGALPPGWDPFAGAPITPVAQPNTPHITVNKTSPPAPTQTPGRNAPGDTGGVNSGVNSPGGGGFGGGIDMSATGGYEGSASVGNTTGAAGFTSPGGGSGFGNVGGSQGSYGSYAGSETTPGSYGGMGSQGGFSMTGGYDPSGYGGMGGLGSGGESGGGAVGGFGGGGGTDPGGSPGGVG